MKINIDMDVTPQEIRSLFGLPDLQSLHDELLDQMQSQMRETMDPAKLVENYLQGSFNSMEAFQRTISSFMDNKQKTGD